jgi:NTE family protein
MAIRFMKQYGYALSGGGGKGGFQAGALYELYKNRIKPTVVSGISVGSLNGIMVATDQYEEMKDIWHSITDDQVRQKMNYFAYAWRFLKHKMGLSKSPYGIWSNEPLRNLLIEKILGKTTVCDFYTGVVDLVKDEFINVHIPKGFTFTEDNIDYYADMILASTAIPVIFPPVLHEDKVLVDGGVHHMHPFKPLSKVIDDKVDHIIAITMEREHPSTTSTRDVKDDVGVIQAVIGNLIQKSSYDSINLFHFINKVAKLKDGSFEIDDKVYRYFPSDVIHPRKQISDSKRFHHEFGKPDFAHGREVMREHIDG